MFCSFAISLLTQINSYFANTGSISHSNTSLKSCSHRLKERWGLAGNSGVIMPTRTAKNFNVLTFIHLRESIRTEGMAKNKSREVEKISCRLVFPLTITYVGIFATKLVLWLNIKAGNKDNISNVFKFN